MSRLFAVLLLACLCGCVPVAYYAAAGGILTGMAAVTNADVSAIKAYCEWRKC